MKRTAAVQDVHVSSNHDSSLFGCNLSFPLQLPFSNRPQQPSYSHLENYSPESEALMVKELTQLTMRERKRIEEEIHGVADAIPETPEFLKERLHSMQEELDAIRKKAAYERALFLAPTFAKDPDFRLKFLRADRFDTVRAARRFVKYFQAKLEFWGLDKLCKEPLTWDDLEEEDRDAVHTGSIWFSNSVDQAGRKIVWISQHYEKFANYKNQVRNVWYQLMNAVQDEDIQRNGLVKCIYNVGAQIKVSSVPYSMDKDLVFKGAPVMFEALPFRMVAMHCCYDDAMIRPAVAAVQHIIGRAGRVRFRAHYGSHLECQYALVTFGIPRHCIPFTDTGELRVDYVRRQLELLQQREREQDHEAQEDQEESKEEPNPAMHFSTTAAPIQKTNTTAAPAPKTLHPTSNDVLLGRGRPFQEFPGNIQLAMLIDQYRETYFSAGRCDKAIISQHLVDVVKGKHKGRFLKRQTFESASSGSGGGGTGGSSWVEVSDDVAKDKVSHGFRTKTKRNSTTGGGKSKTTVQSRNAKYSSPSFFFQQQQQQHQHQAGGVRMPLPTPPQPQQVSSSVVFGNTANMGIIDGLRGGEKFAMMPNNGQDAGVLHPHQHQHQSINEAKRFRASPTM